jgi:hypothetical protein
MITNFKIFEKIENDFLLCIKDSDPDFYWHFLSGSRYKIYNSRSFGVRVKDDEGKFTSINHWNIKNDNGLITYEYADCILVNVCSVKEYEIAKKSNKYNL